MFKLVILDLAAAMFCIMVSTAWLPHRRRGCHKISPSAPGADSPEAGTGRSGSLLQGEPQLKVMIDHILEVILILDSRGVIRSAGTSVERCFGWKPTALVGTAFVDNVPAGDAGRVKQMLRGVLSEERSTTLLECEFRCSDGIYKWIELSAANLLEMRGIDGIFIHCRDISARKKLEHSLLQAQKMQSVGMLAAGAAHDFNNILGIILGSALRLENHRENIDQFRADVAAIEQAVERGSALVEQILAYARRRTVGIERLDPVALVQETVMMLQRTFPRTIVFEESYADDLSDIRGDRTQLTQALLNLCVNARDAMPGGGTIGVKLERLEGRCVQARFPKAVAEAYVCLHINDTGVGMDEVTRCRVFDPFFTTKEDAKGTGLGLAIVSGVMRSHHGFVDVESRKHEGTRFSLYLPAEDIASGKESDEHGRERFNL